ncbi:ATP binding cassette subfamily B MDR TAP [Echinococcus multilocularis]|uniref:ATP binding cassette subfamily B MDR TAP n=1 Tax=Echinococcus multilocularis TaxID=6211 RepID=A0A068Y5Y4_ECHMU|nr:ATP binding cassette subfamily B MDR TAP [Echinococcus multilocularis]
MKVFLPYYISIGSVAFVISFVQMFALTIAAKRQSQRIRLLLFKHILRQDIAWFDKQTSGNLITKLSYSIDQIEGGIGDRLGNFLQNVVTAVGAAIVSLITAWKLALVSFTMAPFILGAFMTLGCALRKYAIKEILAYEKAGSVAAEILTSIRTVFAFGCQERESFRYEKELGASARVFILKSLLMGFGMGMIGCTIFCASALILWYGVELIITESYYNGDIVSVMISFIVGNTSLGRSLPEIEFFANAKRAAASIFLIIDRIPAIDVMGQGMRLDSFSGKIEFRNVSFSYPTRPDVQVLKNFSLTVNPGETVAIVGPSGSGKSTTVQLIQRFYDAVQGSILLDDVDIRDLNVAWLRYQLGVVSQEPNLFAGTVTENILMGKPEAEFKEVEESAREADAHNFVVTLPEAYDTFLTEGGGKLSGGQKQRLAIARALIRKPTVLLLDEATSALDNKSEKVVQAAFDKACKGRTVIMIAHRLTTVRNADRIVVVDRGVVKEMGTHSELLDKGGIYADMLAKQPLYEEDEGKNESSDEDEEAENELGDLKGMVRGDSIRASKISDYDALSSTDADMPVRIKNRKPPLLEVLTMNKPEWPYLAYGLVAIALSGVALPSFSLVYSEIYNLFSMSDPQAKRTRASFLCGIFAILGFSRLFLTASGNAALGISGARLTMRARQLFFKAILKQEVAWFDRPENQAGILAARLATEVQSLHRVTGTQLSTFLECLSLVISALVIAFYYNWTLSLIALAFVPFLFVAGSLQTRQISGTVKQNQVEGANVAQEAFTSYRTVAAFGLEQFIYEKFCTISKGTKRSQYGQSVLFAIVHCLANGTFYFLIAAYYYTAAYLFDRGEVDMPTMFRIFSAVNFAAQGLGRAAAYAPDFTTASRNIKKTLATIQRETQMDVGQGDYPTDPPVGKFEFKNVYFRYPTRRKNPILRNFSYTVQPGTSVAMVGPSGCGKSTLLQLVQRFYDVEDRGPGSGIFLDGRDLRSLAPAWIREQIGIVSQEPNLFNFTIRENIAYGSLKGEPTMEEIIDAAKQANIHDFISGLPEGYETNVGAGGSQLSGGQKQRVAIARALLRKPKVLLLDEATSALDVDSERIVQQTLDQAMREPNGSRTSLVVAHRLTTVMNCDEIVVIMGGRRVESGSPQALLQQKGAFYEIHRTSDTLGRQMNWFVIDYRTSECQYLWCKNADS